jgi:hypothetical protein
MIGRRLLILICVMTVPVVLYWALLKGIDPVIIMIATLAVAVLSILILGWNLYNHFKSR